MNRWRNAAAALLLAATGCSSDSAPVYLLVESDGPWAGTVSLDRGAGGTQTEHTGDAELRLDELGPVVCWHFSMREGASYLRASAVQGGRTLTGPESSLSQDEATSERPWIAGCWERG